MSKGDKQRTGHLDGCGDAERKTRERLIDQDVHQAEGDTKADNREWQGSLRSLPPGPADRHEQKSRKPEAQGGHAFWADSGKKALPQRRAERRTSQRADDGGGCLGLSAGADSSRPHSSKPSLWRKTSGIDQRTHG
ncbi:hypothetical protein [Rhizobium rhizogenes]